MGSKLRVFLLSLLAAGAAGAAASRPETGRSADTLAVETASGWETWWRREASPSRWDGSASLATHVSWTPGAPGVHWGELRLRGSSEAWRTRVVLIRLDPKQVRLSLVPAFLRDERWTVAQVEGDVAVALDTGPYRRSLPYGWVVSGGKELLKPEYAPLAGAVVVSHDGTVRVVAPDEVNLERSRKAALEAFQSYPMLLQNGVVPPPLRGASQGVKLDHRDARLALGTLRDGRVLIALTRFDVLGDGFGRVPFGLTTPEMAAVMGALGCDQAILLDGGISGQLLLRKADGTTRLWPGIRSVPLGLVGRPKLSAGAP
jgi:uncharacterized protein YigE (DUF2233 family)